MKLMYLTDHNKLKFEYEVYLLNYTIKILKNLLKPKLGF